MSAIPGMFAFLRPYPVLEISTGATNRTRAVRVLRLRVTPRQVYDAAGKLMAKLAEYPGFATISLRLLNTRQPRRRAPARTRPRCTASPRRASCRSCAPRTPKLRLSDQEAARPVPGDPRGRGLGAGPSRRSVAALHPVRRREEPRPAEGARHLEDVARPPGREPPEPVHECHLVLQPEARGGPRRRDRPHREDRRRHRSATLRAEPRARPSPPYTVRDLTSSWPWPCCDVRDLAILYESYVHPLTVLSTLPTALVGGLATLTSSGSRRPCTRSSAMFMLMASSRRTAS